MGISSFACQTEAWCCRRNRWLQFGVKWVLSYRAAPCLTSPIAKFAVMPSQAWEKLKSARATDIELPFCLSKLWDFTRDLCDYPSSCPKGLHAHAQTSKQQYSPSIWLDSLHVYDAGSTWPRQSFWGSSWQFRKTFLGHDHGKIWIMFTAYLPDPNILCERFWSAFSAVQLLICIDLKLRDDLNFRDVRKSLSSRMSSIRKLRCHTLYCPDWCIYLMNLQSRCVIGSPISQTPNRIAQDSAIFCCRNGLYINMTIVVVLSEKVGGQAFASASLIDHLQHGSVLPL